MLKIENLHASVEGTDILKGLDLVVKPGEVHAIMGPNGSGKSTLGHVLAGRPGYTVTAGSVSYLGQNLLELETEQRARLGIFLAFQYPVEIPGVSNMEFLKAAVDAQREQRGDKPVDAVTFMKNARETCKLVDLDPAFLNSLAKPNTGRRGLAVAGISNLELIDASGTDQFIDAGTIGMGVNMQIAVSLADDLVDSRHGIAVESKPADGNVGTIK